MGYLADDFLDSATFGWWRRRRGRMLQHESEVDCLFRVIDGDHAALTTKWSRGTARLAPGRIDFRPRSRRHREAVIDVLRVSRHTWREVGFREAMKDQPLLAVRRIGTVHTPTATLEWAVQENQRDWAAETVDPSSRRD